MSSNIAVEVTAKVTDLTSKLAVARADLSITSAELRQMAAQMREAGASASEELKSGLSKAAQAAAGAQSSVGKFRGELDVARSHLAQYSGEGEHSAQIFREKLVLAHESLIGSYKRGAGSLIVLSELTGGFQNALGSLFNPITLTALAIAGIARAFIGAASASEHWAETFGEVRTALDATGQGVGVSNNQIGSYIETLRQLHGVNTETATDMVEMFARQREIGVNSYLALGQAAAGYPQSEQASGTTGHASMGKRIRAHRTCVRQFHRRHVARNANPASGNAKTCPINGLEFHSVRHQKSLFEPYISIIQPVGTGIRRRWRIRHRFRLGHGKRCYRCW